MIIAVSVLTTYLSSRNNLVAARQRNNPQSATTYISVRYAQAEKRQRHIKLTMKMKY